MCELKVFSWSVGFLHTLYLLIKVSVSNVSNGRPYCYSSVSFSFLFSFFLLDFSETPGRIFMKISGMVYNYFSWRLRSNNINITVMDYVILDYRGQVGRKTYSLLATRWCLVFIYLFFWFNTKIVKWWWGLINKLNWMEWMGIFLKNDQSHQNKQSS